MEAKDLRIGNILAFNETINGVVYDLGEKNIGIILTNNIYRDNKEQFKPIELTEDWLLKLGFEIDHKIKGSYHYKFFRYHTQRPYSDDDFLLVTEQYYLERELIVSGGLNYVHQLQNLFFALTGEELELKHKTSACR